MDAFDDGQLQDLPVRAGTPDPAPSGAAADTTEPVHAYGVYIDPATGAQYTLSIGAYTVAQAQSDVASWVSATIAEAQKRAITRLSSRSAKALVGSPSYDAAAWTLISSGTVDHVDSIIIPSVGNNGDPKVPARLGQATAIIKIFRFNTRLPTVDDFLVDAYYTQSPNYVGYQVHFPFGYYFWWNSAMTLDVTASDPWHPSIRAQLVDYAPQTEITTTDNTLSVGGKLSGGDQFSVYSVKTTQPSVTTSASGTLTNPTVGWRDKYVDIVVPGAVLITNPNPPATTSTFAGDRLAVFEVPRTVNDNVPAGSTPGLNVNVKLNSEVHGFRGSILGLALGNIYPAYFKSSATIFAPEPLFSASPTSINVSKSQNSATNPAIVNVTAERPNSGEKLTWHSVQTPSFLTTNVDAHNITGSGPLKIVPNNAQVGQSGFITLNSVPGAASDSLRYGSYQIAVTVIN